ncbi:hypothetical protein ACUNV4_04220 [Granulosicoccus sp. 3-233]|uniref:hypothetical protein n=1 Tax=Granulosicoccus sp. 3-233 TaxID=3417969 RepID=UPI003D32A0FD
MQSQPDSAPQDSSARIFRKGTHNAGSELLRLRQHSVSSYALPARLLLAVLRLSGERQEISDLDRCLLDSLGRILDSSSARRQSIEAINQAASIALTGTRSPFDVMEAGSARLSNDEQLLIDAASQQLRGRHSTAMARLQWLMNPHASRQFLQSIDAIGHSALFRHHGAYALVPSPARLKLQHDKSDMRHNSVLQCADLSPGELLVVNVARVWVKCISLRLNSLVAVHSLGACLGLEGLVTTIHDILHRTAYHATRQFDVRCLCGEEVSPDEARLLATLAAFGHGRPGESVEHLNHWLPETSVQGVLAQVSENRNISFEHDFSLPSRQWDFAGLVQRQILFDHDRKDQAERSIH